MEFVSVFDEASRDHESEDRDHRLTAATVEAQQVWPFLALAQSTEEFGHRLALREPVLAAVAVKHGVPLEEIVRPLQRGFEALHSIEAKGLTCRRCNHSNVPHTDGAVCPCGCTTFSPKTASLEKEASHGHSYDPASIHDLFLNGTKSNPVFYYNEGYDHGRAGAEYKGYGGRDMAILYGHGYRHGKQDYDDAGYDPGHLSAGDASVNNYFVNRQASWHEDHLARLHRALMDGQDPLTWIQQQAPPPAQTPTHHDTTEEFLAPESGNRNARDQALEQAGGGTKTHHDTTPVTSQRREGGLPF